MALPNQSELPAFFSHWQVNLKISINSGIRQAGKKIVRRPEDDFRLLVENLLASDVRSR
jgi:hypothetical protein